MIFTKSNKHPRTINTPTMGRTYFDCVEVNGLHNMQAKVAELFKAGETITEICSLTGKWFVDSKGNIF
jgi:hypothetical protein